MNRVARRLWEDYREIHWRGQGKNTRKMWRDCTYWTAVQGLSVITAKCIQAYSFFNSRRLCIHESTILQEARLYEQYVET
jgi:hypothetical protein